MNPALRMGKPPRAKVACEEPQDEGNDCARTGSACSGMPLVAMDDDEGHLPNPVLDYEGDEVDLKLTATAFAAHERLRRSGRGDNYFGKSTMTRFFKLLMGHPDMLRGIMLWMPDRDPFERLSGVWAAMSVYGSLVGVCALSYGMPDASSSERTLTYHISSSIMLCASMFLIIPVCQLTVLTVFFSTVPAHQMRQQLSKHRWITSVTGPIHLIATQIFAVGMVIRLFSVLDFEPGILLLYLLPFLVAFLSMWFFTMYTCAVTMDLGLHEDAWQEAIDKATAARGHGQAGIGS